MRDHKYKVWSKKYKKMYEVLHLHLDSFEGSWTTVKGFDIIEQKDIHIQIQPKDGILIEFTGLKDKNKKEIFEGDIIPWIHHINYMIHKDKTLYNCVVTYKDGAYWLINEENEVAELLRNACAQDWNNNGDNEACCYDDIGICEVIGNIHSHPELVKK